MADNWWDSSSRTRPCLDSVSVTSINLFQDTATTTTTTTATATGATSGTDPSLQMMGLGLSSPSLDWNQPLFRGDQNTNSFQIESNQWRSQKMYPSSSQDSSSDFKHNSDNNSSFQNMDSYGSPSTIMQSLFGSDHNNSSQPQQQQDSGFIQNQGMSGYSLYPSRYGGLNVAAGGGELSPSNWSKYPPPVAQDFPATSPPKVQLPEIGGSQLQFSNNTRFWNAPAAGINDVRSSFFPSLQMQLPSSTYEDKPKHITSKVVKESSSESSSTKRPRSENPSSLPAFKVKKEKMGDRITALQQLVSPFGKTDTASVLSEAIEYIKFLHEQVSVLSTPYMKNGAPVMQQQQTPDKSSEGAPRQDLRNRGLCLVPVSSTFPVTHETTVDFWTPTFGGTFR